MLSLLLSFHNELTYPSFTRYAVIDRKIAIIQSNNIQDIDNLEMMAQFEGDIVDSFYDVALISWHSLMSPTLPCINRPNIGAATPTFDAESYATLFDDKGKLVHVYQAYGLICPSLARCFYAILTAFPVPRQYRKETIPCVTSHRTGPISIYRSIPLKIPITTRISNRKSCVPSQHCTQLQARRASMPLRDCSTPPSNPTPRAMPPRLSHVTP